MTTVRYEIVVHKIVAVPKEHVFVLPRYAVTEFQESGFAVLKPGNYNCIFNYNQIHYERSIQEIVRRAKGAVSAKIARTGVD